MARPCFDDGCPGYRRTNRRQVLSAGMLGGFGLALPDLLRMQAAQAAEKAAARNCILLWLRGGPPAIDMWDMKPDAPAEVRGPFKPIPTNVSGVHVSEHLPLCAKIADKYCLVRSVFHASDDHELASHINITGWNTWPAQPYPMFGTVVQKLLGYSGALPPHVHLPEPPQASTGGKHYLSKQDLPFTISCINDPDLHVPDMSLAGSSDTARFSRRRRLLASTGADESELTRVDDGLRTNDVFYRRAFDLLTAPTTRSAFDITREPAKVRDLYGRPVLAKDVVAQGNAGDIAPNDYNRSVVGQALLMARRLVEADVRFVTVIGRGWDTHADNFNRLKDGLLPYLDRALHALLTDLDQRGLLASTLVMVTGDFGRTPKINKDAGRDHWGHTHTVLLAGAGIPGGTVIGSTDVQCAYPEERPVPAQDLAATLFHKLGISGDTELHAPDGRPFRVLPFGAEPVRELI